MQQASDKYWFEVWSPLWTNVFKICWYHSSEYLIDNCTLICNFAVHCILCRYSFKTFCIIIFKYINHFFKDIKFYRKALSGFKPATKTESPEMLQYIVQTLQLCPCRESANRRSRLSGSVWVHCICQQRKEKGKLSLCRDKQGKRRSF